MKRNLLPTLMFMVLLSPLAIDIYLPSMPMMATDYGVSHNQVQSTLVLFLFALGVGQILIGPLADRYGRRPIALFGIVLYGLSSWAGAVAENFEVLQLVRVLQGIGACSTSIVVFSAVRDCYNSKESVPLYSYLNGAICVIPALAPTFGGVLAMHFGWRSTFIFMSLYAVLVAAVVILRFPETRPANTDSSGPLYRWHRYKPVLSDGQFVFYAGACMIGMASILTYVSYSSIWLIGHLHLSKLAFSGLFALNASVNLVACFSAPKLVKKIGNRPSVIMALVLMLLAAILEALLQLFGPQAGMPAALGFMLPMILLCVGFAILLGPATSMALSGFGERAGTAAAMLGFIQMSGASVLTAVIQLTPITAPWAVVVVLGCTSTLYLVLMVMPQLKHCHQEKHG
ncbi:multidrug effflux MFS transporter [Shewanella intestini]|uniref:Bcr/CflA family efflux transporter n=1 Tax=Shewanella intestini TaxID=2017544 RepID=A0ABS5I3X3_9GAMM|nr:MULTISPECIES: multidrug effflux MFS transporter [Shewanella]MBR9728731.1 multidrug effflux MFS transporter [Shewanella intestini]MRG36807.1 Bcr/CflA family efflux MFS transporter [Shewanella sp. XMDDZSB0408]